MNDSAHGETDSDFPLEGIRVLLVEDNFFNQLLASKILENWRCQVEIAGNGHVALEKIQENIFDIILMDIQLPEMDGYEATSYIRTKLSPPKSTVPIIAMSAHALANEIEKCLSLGMNDYVSKPFDDHILYAKILKVLRRKIS